MNPRALRPKQRTREVWLQAVFEGMDIRLVPRKIRNEAFYVGLIRLYKGWPPQLGRGVRRTPAMTVALYVELVAADFPRNKVPLHILTEVYKEEERRRIESEAWGEFPANQRGVTKMNMAFLVEVVSIKGNKANIAVSREGAKVKFKVVIESQSSISHWAFDAVDQYLHQQQTHFTADDFVFGRVSSDVVAAVLT